MTPDLVRRTPSAKWLGLAGFGVAAAAAALIGGLGVAGTVAEYQSLRQPAWAPPSWLFGPVWTVLYVLIAVSGWLVWRRTGWTSALTVYAVQLALNAAWTPIFFTGHAIGAGLIVVAMLLVMVLWTIRLTWRFDRVAAWLLVPYAAWVAFATLLNAAILRMN